ncbi:MAG: hypothetical protein ABIP19_04680, partial [Dermatophilaceae bacterium]
MREVPGAVDHPKLPRGVALRCGPRERWRDVVIAAAMHQQHRALHPRRLGVESSGPQPEASERLQPRSALAEAHAFRSGWLAALIRTGNEQDTVTGVVASCHEPRAS